MSPILISKETESLTEAQIRQHLQEKPQLLTEQRVTVLEDFHVARVQGLEDKWLIPKVLGVQTSDQKAIARMSAGSALHEWFEDFEPGADRWVVGEMGPYHFDFNCEVELVIPKKEHREVELSRYYDGFKVTGHADGLLPEKSMVVDYKSTTKFDFDRYMDSFQWRLYLDMAEANQMLYQIFVWKNTSPFRYSIEEFHPLSQFAYPGMHDDCVELVRDYRNTVVKYLEQFR
jgi:hypothetical protein